MTPFQMKINPKSLPIKDMWNLYRTLQSGVSENSQEFLIDELDSMLKGISEFQFKRSLELMYEKIDFTKNPVELLLLFTRGIKKNNLFEFSDFIKRINGRSK